MEEITRICSLKDQVDLICVVDRGLFFSNAIDIKSEDLRSDGKVREFCFGFFCLFVLF